MPKLNNKSQQYLFKNKLNRGLKSNVELIRESSFMMSGSIFLIFIIYLIPEKNKFFNNFGGNFEGIFSSILEITYYLLEIIIVLFMVISILISAILIIGSFNRLLKLLFRKRRIRYR